MIVTRTPYRISFFGGGSDYPEWYEGRGGAVLSTTIDKYCYVAVRPLLPIFEGRLRVVHSRVESCDDASELDHPAVRGALTHFGLNDGVEVHCIDELPPRSGIGSSSSLVVGLVRALSELTGRSFDDDSLARTSAYIERTLLGEVVGFQDQVAAAFGGFNYVTFHSRGTIGVEPVEASAERLSELESRSMLFFLGTRAPACEIAKTYVPELERRSAILYSLVLMAQDGRTILEGGGDLDEFGELLHGAWELKKGISPIITTAAIDDAYARARSAGALGGKILGAGGGGGLLLYARPADHSRIERALSPLPRIPFRFEPKGSEVAYRAGQPPPFSPRTTPPSPYPSARVKPPLP